MKKILTAALLPLMLASCGSSQKDSYTISGHIEGLPDSSTVILTELSHTSSDTIGQALVTDGNFTITGVAEEPRAVLLLVNGHYGYKTFMLENADITISGTASSKEAHDGKLNFDFGNVSVAGSSLTDTLNIKMAGRHRLDSLFNLHYETYSQVMAEANMAYTEKNQSRLDSIHATDTYKAMAANEKYLFAALDSNFVASVKENSDSYWGPLLMISQTSYLDARQRELFESLGDNAKNSYYGRLVAEELYPVGRPGDKMPEFEAVTIDGTKTSLAELCKDKKYVILDFWASWCGPCRREIPNLKAIYADHAGKGFDIISISIDKEEKPWLNAVKNEGLEWVNIRDTDHSIADKYKVSAVPTMYIIDSEGRLVAENLRGEELAAKISELMAK